MIIWTLATGQETDLNHRLLQAASRVLSDEEQTRAGRFQFEADRNRFTLAHALCRLLLSSQGELEPSYWEFGREKRGRPYVVNTSLPLDFNLSHTRGMVGCALSSSGRVGFDLEYCPRNADIKRLAEKKFAAKESEDVLSLPSEEQRALFFRYWTLKEAYIKVTGMGLHEALDSFCFDLAGANPVCQHHNQRLDDYRFGLFQASQEHQAAWAVWHEKGQEGQNAQRYSNLEPEIKHLSIEEFQRLLI